MRKRRRRDWKPRCDYLDDRCLLSGYTPAQITSAYGLSGITFTSPSGKSVAGNGAGQTIALIEMDHDPNIQASLDAFDAEYGLPSTTLDVIDQAGSQTDSGWAEEETLDVEWAHAIAPGANIVVVEAAPGNTDALILSNLMTAVQTATNTAGVSVVSMSWGLSEFSNETTYDSNFTAPGITYIASSGDSGQVEWPAVSPNVLAVGGTSLEVSGSGAYESESGWVDAGGGVSRIESEPRAIKRPSRRPDIEARQTFRSSRIPIRASRSITSRPPARRARDSGKRSAAPASAHPPGPGSSPSWIKGARSRANRPSAAPARPCRPSTR